MPFNRFYFATLLFLLAVLGYLTYSVMNPFLPAILWAVVFSIVFYPVYAFLSRHIKIRSVASVLTILLIVVIILAPFTYVSLTLLKELQAVALKINENRLETIHNIVERIQSSALMTKINSYLGANELVSEQAIMENIKKIGTKMISDIPLRITNILSTAVNFIFMIFTVFFLFRDGPAALAKVKNYMPFREHQKERLARQIKDIVVSTVYGGVLVAIIQGVLGGIAFFVLGVASPVLWGVAMSVMSFVPLLGTFIIWGPASGFFIMQGKYFEGIGLFLFGVFVISMVDNILKPRIIGGRTKMPTIVILFSVLGGIKVFGILGLIMGPLITALFISVFEIFRNVEEGEV